MAYKSKIVLGKRQYRKGPTESDMRASGVGSSMKHAMHADKMRWQEDNMGGEKKKRRTKAIASKLGS